MNFFHESCDKIVNKFNLQSKLPSRVTPTRDNMYVSWIQYNNIGKSIATEQLIVCTIMQLRVANL
jgi:hypothetical protein